jgi:hypothetical protein
MLVSSKLNSLLCFSLFKIKYTLLLIILLIIVVLRHFNLLISNWSMTSLIRIWHLEEFTNVFFSEEKNNNSLMFSSAKQLEWTWRFQSSYWYLKIYKRTKNLVFRKFQRKVWFMSSCCVSWSIWLMRNKVIFNNRTATFKDSFSLIPYRLLNWLKSADKFFMATDTTLIMEPEGIIDWSNTKLRL